MTPKANEKHFPCDELFAIYTVATLPTPLSAVKTFSHSFSKTKGDEIQHGGSELILIN